MNISSVEVTNISPHGFWMLVHGKELFLSYEDFPWFKDKTVRQISNVIEESETHLFWPDIDVDLTYDSILYPDKYPLRSKA
jgi:hypothetical protein